jgi:hypothetical protein
MITDSDFYQELGRVPDLPPHLYGKVRKEIRRGRVLPRALFAAAAALILMVGSLGLWRASKTNEPVALSTEVTEELQSLNSYVNGSSIHQDLEAYAFYEGEMSSEETR